MKSTVLSIEGFIRKFFFGIIDSESSVASDIAKKLKDNYSKVKLDSRTKRIKRLFTNKFFDLTFSMI